MKNEANSGRNCGLGVLSETWSRRGHGSDRRCLSLVYHYRLVTPDSGNRGGCHQNTMTPKAALASPEVVL